MSADWNKCEGFTLPTKMVDLVMRLQRLVLVEKIQALELMIDAQDLSSDARAALHTDLTALRKALGETQ